MSDDEMETPNVTGSLVIFFWLTFLYFFLRYMVVDKYMPLNADGQKTEDGEKKGGLGPLFTIFYFVLVIMSQMFINMKVTQSICGDEIQTSTAMSATIIPNVIILGVVYIMLVLVPGWKSPFANTFGYFAANIGGIRDVLNTLTNTNFEEKGEGSIVLKQNQINIFKSIYKDPSQLINNITPENFHKFLKTMRNIKYFKPSNEVNDRNVKKLYSLVVIKDLVSQFIWYMLAGYLVITTTYDSLINMKCQSSEARLKKLAAKNEVKN